MAAGAGGCREKGVNPGVLVADGPCMSIVVVMSAVTLCIGVFGVVVYLWTAGASLLMAMEIHNLRVDTHQLRIDYAKRIAGETDEEIIEVDAEEPSDEDAAEPAGVIGASATPARAAA